MCGLQQYLAVNDGRKGDKGENESEDHKENACTKAYGPVQGTAHKLLTSTHGYNFSLKSQEELQEL